MPRAAAQKPLDPVEARKVSQLCAKLLAGPQSRSAQTAAVKLSKQLATCPAAAAEVRRAGGVRRLQARPPKPARDARNALTPCARSFCPLVRRSEWPLSHFCLSQAMAVFGEDGDGELSQLCARDAAQTALRLMGESTTPPVGDAPAPREPWGLASPSTRTLPRPQPRPQPRPHPRPHPRPQPRRHPHPRPHAPVGRTPPATSMSSPSWTAAAHKPA